MNNIIVPKEYQHMLRAEKISTEEHMPQIRAFIEANPNKPLYNKHFNELIGRTSAMSHIKRLMRQGYITRQRVYKNGRGKKFSYTWHAVPLPPDTAKLANGGTITHSLNLPAVPVMENIRGLFMEFAQPIANQPEIGGALQFTFWLEDKIKEVIKQREEILNANASSSDSPVASVPRTTEEEKTN